MAVLLGGRAAEEVVFGQLSTGAADDLSKATDIATQHGHALRHGPGAGEPHLRGRSPGVPARRVVPVQAHASASRPLARSTVAARGIVDAAFGRARQILERNRQVLLDAAAVLLSRGDARGGGAPSDGRSLDEGAPTRIGGVRLA